MFQLQCCGVNDNYETLIMQRIQFCCKNAHPGILDSDEKNTISNSIFDYFGGCGGYKTEVSLQNRAGILHNIFYNHWIEELSYCNHNTSSVLYSQIIHDVLEG